MRQVRVGVLVAVCAVVLAGCGTPPSADPPVGVDNKPAPAPTAPVGADGAPIVSLCDLLAEADFTELAGQTAQKPTPLPSGATSGTCDYGSGMTMNVQVGSTVDDAIAAYATRFTNKGFTAVKTKDAISGVDESSYGTAAGGGVMNLRRLKLVVSIAVPGTDSEVKLIQLAGRVLSRANALGT